MADTTARDVGGALAAVLVAVAIAWAGSQHSATLGGWPVFALCGVLAFAVQWLMFVHAWLTRSERLYDLVGSLTYLGMVWFAVWASDATGARALLLAGLITIWALRLGPFLFLRVRQAGEDRRFRSIKQSFATFFMAWTLQGLWVYLTAACALAALTGRLVVPLGWAAWIGALLWVLGFAIEVIADRQKTAFRSDPANRDGFIRSGLWAWSRHPNYFGEILLWVGIAVIALPALVGWQYITLISPLFVTVLLTRISGVPMLEARARKQWGDDPDYQRYVADTPVLMLKPPRSA